MLLCLCTYIGAQICLIKEEKNMGKMYDRYWNMLERGEYDSVDELCNDLQLNTDDLYEDDEEEED